MTAVITTGTVQRTTTIRPAAIIIHVGTTTLKVPVEEPLEVQLLELLLELLSLPLSSGGVTEDIKLTLFSNNKG